VGAIHALSKRTSIFGGYQRVSQGGTGASAPSGPGTAGESTVASSGSYLQGNRNTWTMGLRHSF
ncbi:MAG: porin, partial [Deltaproteobacteria bacterium]